MGVLVFYQGLNHRAMYFRTKRLRRHSHLCDCNPKRLHVGLVVQQFPGILISSLKVDIGTSADIVWLLRSKTVCSPLLHYGVEEA